MIAWKLVKTLLNKIFIYKYFSFNEMDSSNVQGKKTIYNNITAFYWWLTILNSHS